MRSHGRRKGRGGLSCSTLLHYAQWISFAAVFAFEFEVQELSDPLPDDCSMLTGAGTGPAAAVLRPINMSASHLPNITIITCVKHVDGLLNTAWLHVVSADDGYDRRLSENPLMLTSGSTAIEWGDVPMGKHAAFIEIRGKASAWPDRHSGERGDTRSKPCFFSRIGEEIIVAGESRTRELSKNDRSEDQDCASESSNEWPLLQHLKQISSSSHAQFSSFPATRNSNAPTLGTQSDEVPRWCGVIGWESVSMHEVVAAFLRSEWYKQEHDQWRGVQPFEEAVRSLDTTSDHMNVLRAMLMATPRKTNMLRTLPVDTRWFRTRIRTHDLSAMHIICEKSWGEEFRGALGLPKGSSALAECAAMNVSQVAGMLAACMPHCPAVKEEGGAVRDNTDMLPALEGEEEPCGRHCFKMHSVLSHLRRRAAAPSLHRRSSSAPVIVMAEERRRSKSKRSRASPCVLLEGNHRAVPLFLLSRDLEGPSLSEVEVLLGVSPHMRNSTYFFGVAAGIERYS